MSYVGYSGGHPQAHFRPSPATAGNAAGGSSSSAAGWSPMGQSGSFNGTDAARDDDDDEDDDDDDDDDDDEEDDEDDEEDAGGKQRGSKKRKRTDGNAKGKGASNNASGGRGSNDDGQQVGPDGKKPKPTRGAKACKNCRRLKMRCVGAENGPPCDRCKHTNHACIFEESNRGKKGGKNQRTEAMAASLRKMEATMNNLIRSLKDPASAFSQGAGMVTRSPSPATLDRERSERSAANQDRRVGGPSSSSSSSRFFNDRQSHTSQLQDRERLSRGWPSVDEADELGRIYPAQHSSNSEQQDRDLRWQQTASPGGGHVNPRALDNDGRFLGGGAAGSSQPSPATAPTALPMGATTTPAAVAAAAAAAAATTGTRFVEPERPIRQRRHGSPRLHSLPDNTLNPLGLLAEASLHNHQRARRMTSKKGSNTLDDTARIALRATGGFASSQSGSASSPGSQAGGTSVAMSGGSPAGAIKQEGGSESGGVAAANGTGPGAGATEAESEGPRSTSSPEKHGENGASDAPNTAGGLGKRPSVADVAKEEYVEFPGAERAKLAKVKMGTSGLPGPSGGQPGDETPERVHLGVASETYFKPGPMTILPLRRIVIERELPPELLTQGIISSQEVLELFQIFFHHCSQHVVLLDPEWHTPTMICSRSPFLFTCVCTVASKFYAKRPELHLQCLQQAKKSAYMIMSRGFKSVEIVQGFMLLCLWNQPAERFEEDKTWLFSGVAIRMATDLNLHRKSVASLPGNPHPDDPVVVEREREIINRERTWLMCFSIDRSISGQMGKPWTIREDWIIRNSRHWCLQRLSQPWDLGISGLVELLRLTSRQLDFLYSSTTSVSGLNTEIDYGSILRVFNEQIEEWHSVWTSRGFFRSPHEDGDVSTRLRASAVEEAVEKEASSSATATEAEKEAAERYRSANTNAPPSDDEDHHRRTLHFITKQAPMRYNYAVLILNSFGLQHAVDFPTRSGLDKGLYFTKCLEAAKGIVAAACDGLRPVLRYSPDTHFVIISYACVFLLKLTRPTFANYVDEDEVLAVVTDAADLLDSVSMFPTHTPALYAAFLRALVQARQERTGTSRSGATTPYGRSRGASPMGADANGDLDNPPEGGAYNSTEGGSAAAAASGTTGEDSMNNNNNAASNPAGAAFNLGLGMSNPSQGMAHPSSSSLLNAGLGNFAMSGQSSLTAEQAAALNGMDPHGGGPGAINGMQVDQLLNDSFWSSLLPPGFGGPLDGLATGSVEMHPIMTPSASHQGGPGGGHHSGGHRGEGQTGPPSEAGFTPGQTRASTPSMLNTFGPNVSRLFSFSSSFLSLAALLLTSTPFILGSTGPL